MEEKPAETAGQPAETAGQPAETAGQPAETAGQPAETAGQPVEQPLVEQTVPAEPLIAQASATDESK